jgi:hypothetical protein
MPTLTFTKVFTAQGSKNGKDWTRWDYKTGDDTKYSTFKDLTSEITLGEPVNVEVQITTSGEYTNRSILGVLPSGGKQATGTIQEATQPVRSQMVASQGVSDDARGKTKAIYAAQMGAALFQSLDKEEQTIEAAVLIMDKLLDYAFQG